MSFQLRPIRQLRCASPERAGDRPKLASVSNTSAPNSNRFELADGPTPAVESELEEFDTLYEMEHGAVRANAA